LQVNIMLSIIEYNGPFMLMLWPSSNAVHLSPCTVQQSICPPVQYKCLQSTQHTTCILLYLGKYMLFNHYCRSIS
jgi:hypothetical protein